MTRLPAAARQVFEAGTLCYLAVPSPLGPHVTPVVFALDAGRLWVTTARSSVKARAWRRDPSVAGLVVAEDLAVSFRGRVRTYDALDPSTWPSVAIAGPRLLSATARFSLRNARFFAGYAVDARKVPLAWTPPGRVFASIEIRSGAVLAGGEVLHAWGAPPPDEELDAPSTFVAARGPVDAEDPMDLVPRVVAGALPRSGDGVVSVQGQDGPTVVPARFGRNRVEGVFDVCLPESSLDWVRPRTGSRASLVIDHASTWRAADMLGVLIRGTARLSVPARVRRGRSTLLARLEALGVTDPGSALLRVRPESVVWWEGWASGSARVGGRRTSGRR